MRFEKLGSTLTNAGLLYLIMLAVVAAIGILVGICVLLYVLWTHAPLIVGVISVTFMIGMPFFLVEFGEALGKDDEGDTNGTRGPF